MNDFKKINLITKAINGDKNSIIELIKAEQSNIYGMLLYLKKDENDICDIAQNILIKLANGIKNLKNPLSYKTWLNQIILNSFNDYLRKNAKNKVNVSIDNIEKDIIFDIPDETNNPQEFVLGNELDNVIKKSINRLPMHYKVPITLREIQGLTYSEISNLTKTSVGTVKSRIARARALIQDDINKYSKS